MYARGTAGLIYEHMVPTSAISARTYFDVVLCLREMQVGASTGRPQGRIKSRTDRYRRQGGTRTYVTAKGGHAGSMVATSLALIPPPIAVSVFLSQYQYSSRARYLQIVCPSNPS